jgi:hypothetical protein
MIERKGALTALLTTQGFKDSIEIGRETRYDLYDLMIVALCWYRVTFALTCPNARLPTALLWLNWMKRMLNA